MNRTLPEFFKREYNHFKKELIDEWGVTDSEFLPHEPTLKAVHKRYLSLACTASVIGRRAKVKEYLEGVIEVGYLCQCVAVKGLENPACVLLRQSIELVLKHVYFSFHPIEHHWASTRQDYRDVNFQFLLEFIRRTDEHRKFVSKANLCKQLNQAYGILSRHVHVHSKGFLGYSKIGSPFLTDVSVLRQFDRRTRQLWPFLVILLIIFFPEKYHRAQEAERRLMLSSIPPKLRRFLHLYCSQRSKSQYK